MSDASEVEAIYRQLKPSIRRVLNLLNGLDFKECKEEINYLESELTIAKRECPSTQDEVLNGFYVLAQYISMHSSYSDLWEKITNGTFAASWGSLQDALGLLRTVKKFSSPDPNQDVGFFEAQLQNLEKLYPYNFFFSAAVTVELFECSICGKDLDSFDCPHIRGELYRGEMAYGIARNIVELDHVAMVTHPSDKRCVVQYDDNGKEFKLVRFLSDLISSGKLRPSDFGELRFSLRKTKNPDFQKMGRNEPCYCGSGKKFKSCCISKEFITNDHVDIVAKPKSVEEIIA